MILSIRGLLFDNDGVLVDSRDAVHEAWAKWSQEYGLSGFSIDEHHGKRAQDLVLETVGEELFEAANNRINEFEQLSAHQTTALPGALELTRSLPREIWTICTSANPRLGLARIQAAGIEVPKTLVTADDVTHGKPSPEPYLLGASRLGFDVRDCVVFEDAPAGIKAGIAAGAGLVVGISASALGLGADIVVSSLEAVSYQSGQLFIDEALRLD